MGFHHDVGHLRTKGVKAKQARLRLILKNLKNYHPIKMDVIRRRMLRNRSANAVWNLDSTHKLVTHNFSVSGAVDGFIRCIIWLKCSNNNRGNISHDLFKESINKNFTPLQVIGDNGSENTLIAKHMLMVRNTQCRGCIGGRSTHKTRIECFWREFNVNVMINFNIVFERLESLGHQDTDNSTDLWSSHYVFLDAINQKNHGFK